MQSNSDDEYYILGANGETEAVFYANGIVKFYNITNGNEIIGRMTPPVNNLTLTNTTLVGNYQASSTITAETNVVVNGTATLKTPGTIYLKPGFTANSGCNLTISVGAVKTDKYYYLKDHLGSIRVVVDTVGEIVSYSDYDPWGMILNGRSSNFGFADDKYKFTGKERDVETGYDYFGARYYDSRLGRWLQVDPLSDKYPGWNPYNYTMNNPLRFIDPTGTYSTTYTDENGNVERVVDDGSTDIMRKKKDGSYKYAGQTVSIYSFVNQEDPYDANGNLNVAPGAKIDFNSTWAGDKIQASLSEISANIFGFIEYASNANNKQKYDLKSKASSVYYGSKIAPGLYASARDAGNILAGAVVKKTGLNFDFAMSGFGALQMAKNNVLLGGAYLLYSYMSHGNLYGAKSNILGLRGIKNFGESLISHKMQVFGYNNY